MPFRQPALFPPAAQCFPARAFRFTLAQAIELIARLKIRIQLLTLFFRQLGTRDELKFRRLLADSCANPVRRLTL